jgi:hypothetical protein
MIKVLSRFLLVLGATNKNKWVKVLGDDEDASFTSVKVFPGEVTSLILGLLYTEMQTDVLSVYPFI